MTKLILIITLTAFASNIRAQGYGIDWYINQSLSNGAYKSNPVGFFEDDSTLPSIIVASNDFYEPTEDSVKGVIRKYDNNGNLQWSVTLQPAVSTESFPDVGIVRTGPKIPYTWHPTGIIAYNTDPTTAWLIQVDTGGSIVFNNIISNINQVCKTATDSNGNVYVLGRTPVTTCGIAQCNGFALAKYNSNGQLQWKKTKYTSGGFIVEPTEVSLDGSGNIIVCGKKAPYFGAANDRDVFVTKYSPAGTALWTKELVDALTDVPADVIYRTGGVPSIYVAYTTSDLINQAKKAVLKKLDAATGNVLWTKTINNSELINLYNTSDEWPIIATSTGMRAYNDAGTLLWSNTYIVADNFHIDSFFDIFTELTVVATNVDAAKPLNYFLVQLQSTGQTTLKKDLSFGNHEPYQGDYESLLIGEASGNIYLLMNDTTPPYGTRVTKLSPCSEFTFSFNTSAAAVNVSNGSCNNGQVSVNWSGIFNSWPHLELWKGSNKVAEADPVSSPHVFQNLSPASYTVKAFDESCGEQDITVTVKCPAPSSGLTTTNITSLSAKANWNAPPCNNTFRIQYRQTGTIAWTKVSGITNPSYTITGLSPGLSYQWQVATKCNSTGTAVYSNFSAIKTFTTLGPRLENTNESAVVNELKMALFPNPAVSQVMLTLEGLEQQEVQLQLFDMLGRNVLTESFPVTDGTVERTINLKNYKKGVYLLRIWSAGQSKTERLVIE